MASESPAPAIGIDLGTTFSCVAVVTDKVNVIKNNKGSSTVPSYVSFTETGRCVGQRAKDRALMEPENTVNNMKRLIGRTLADEHVKKAVQSFPFKVVDGGNGKPKVQVKHQGLDKLFSPEEISSAVLGELKTMAEEFLGKTVKDAVITVPAYFTDAQRKATIDAGTIAGLNILGTINEPTAAALAYGFDNSEDSQHQTVLIYDFGGGTFDVSLLNVQNGEVEVLSSGGDGNLGGEDIDDLLVMHLNLEFQKKYDIDISSRASDPPGAESRNAKKALKRLRFACEKLKIELSSARNARIDLDLLFDGKDLYAKVTRDFLENLCKDLIKRTIPIVKETVELANMTLSDVAEIILVGGTTRIPLVTEILGQLFPHKEIYGGINPDEAVAYGAAIKAALMSGVDQEVIKKVRLRDVTPMSLGIESSGGFMVTIIKRNSGLPVRKMKVFTTNRDNQTEIRFKVFEGERHLTKHNNFLGEFTLVGIPVAPRKVPKIEVVFEVDINGMLKVKATDLGTEWVSDIQVSTNGSRLSPEEIERAVRNAEEMRQQDLSERRRIQAQEKLVDYARQIAKALRNPRIKEILEEELLRKLSEKVEEALQHPSSFLDTSETDYEGEYNELQKLWLPVISRCYEDTTEENRDAPVLSENSFYQDSGFEIVDKFP